MVQLRPYQESFINDIRKKLGDKKKIIACAATGAGKTKVFLSITETAISRGWTVLILTESRKIYKQIVDERPCYEINAEVKHLDLQSGSLYTAMAQTLSRRPFIISQLQNLSNRLLIINDEAHVGTSTKLLQQLPNALLLGFTATPDFKVAPHLVNIYKDIVVGPQPSELVEMGFLSKYRHFMRTSVDMNKLQKKGGEFTEESQFDAFATTQVFEGILEDINNFQYKKCLIFCSSIKHAEVLQNQMYLNGYKTTIVHSKLIDADENLKQFMEGEINICISVGILTKGFDFPKIDLIILNRATTSLALYCQMIGRGSRTTKDKNSFIVLDYGENADRHGLWDDFIDWENIWNKKQKKNGVAPIKKCPNCFYAMPAKTSVCPECGYKLEAEEKELQIGELIEVTKKENSEFKSIKNCNAFDLSPYQLSIYVKERDKKGYGRRLCLKKGREFAMEYAKFMGYKSGWAYYLPYDPTIEIFNVTIK